MAGRIIPGSILWVCTLVLSAQSTDPRVTLDLVQASFDEFVHQVESQTGVRIHYQREWTENLAIDMQVEEEEVRAAIRIALSGTGLVQQKVNGSIVLLRGGPVKDSLSHLTGRQGPEDPERAGPAGTDTGEVFLSGTRAENIVPTLVVGSGNGNTSRKVARIRGKIRDVESGEPVIGATFLLLESGKGSISDQNGVVQMSLKPGKYRVQVSFIGMETLDYQLEVRGDGEFRIPMKSAVIALNEVQIVGDQYRAIHSTDVGVDRLSMKSVERTPLFMGENDVIRISKLLPGITSAGEASAGVNVRGGSADQNIFYVNRLPVYNTSHMFGFLSAFNSDIVKDFSVYKGNVPANLGGRLSSVFNIITRKGNQKKYTAHAGISPVSAHATLEGPLIRDKASFLMSGRSSYSDWMLNRMEDPLLRESRANFYDLSLVLSGSPGKSDEIQGFYYRSFDQFAYGDLHTYDYTNHGGSLFWKHDFNPALSSVTTVAVSRYDFGHNNKEKVSSAYAHRYRLGHFEAQTELSLVPGLHHHLKGGFGAVYYSLHRGRVVPFNEESLRIPIDLGREKGLEGNIFISDQLSIFPWLSVYAGFRYSFYSALGPARVRLYEEDQPKSEATVTDTLHFDNNQALSWSSGPEFRTAVNIKANDKTSFKISFNQMRQYLFMLTNTVTISPTDQWKLSDYHISPPRGNQYSAGLYRIWPRAGISGSVEIYYKRIRDVVEFRDGAVFIGTPFTEITTLQGTQRAYGVELMIQKNAGRFEGWVNYTYSRSLVRVRGEHDFESINRGEPYPANFDRPNVLNMIGTYHLSRRVSLSSNLVYMTGRPVTFPSSLYFIGETVYIDYYKKNEFRVPDYFRVDASITLEGNLKAKKLFHSTWSLNAYNLLGRKNPQSIFFEPVEDYLKGFSFSVIGVPIVTVAWNIKLGNYESN